MRRLFSSSNAAADDAGSSRVPHFAGGRLRMIYAAPHIPEMQDVMDYRTGGHVIEFEAK